MSINFLQVRSLYDQILNKSAIITDAGNQADKSLIELFEDQVLETPDAVAIVFGHAHLTYLELNMRSNQLAHYLQKQGVVQDMPVPVLIERGLEMVIGILAILKAGGQYVPLDMDYPSERITFILGDISASLIVSSTAGRARLVDLLGLPLIEVDGDRQMISEENAGNPEHKSLVWDHVFITGITIPFGRTERKKTEHRNVVSLFRNERQLFDFTKSDTWVMFHSFCLDVSVWEMFGALLSGGKLIIASATTVRDQKLFVKLLKEEKVTILTQTPSSYYNIAGQDYISRGAGLFVRYIIVAGEILDRGMLQQWRVKYPLMKLINMYEITEPAVPASAEEAGNEEFTGEDYTEEEIEEDRIRNNSGNIGISTSTLGFQYADYTIWQRSYLQDELPENMLVYWKEKLKGVLQLELPADFIRPAIQSSRCEILNFKIDKELTASLQFLSQRQGATLYMTLLSVFKVLLYRYTGQEDICVGTLTAARKQLETSGENIFFSNTLALRTNVSGYSSFIELLDEVKNTAMEAYSHHEISFDKVVNALLKTCDQSRHPLFQAMFVLQNTPEIPELRLGDLYLSEEIREHSAARSDISFILTESTDGLHGRLEFSNDLFARDTIDRMAGHYLNLLRSVTESPESRISVLNMMDGAEKALLNGFNLTDADFPGDKGVVELFEEQVLETPDAIAVVFENEYLSYHELNARSNQLAHYLQKQGVVPEMLVPVCTKRGLQMIIGILGILKAGGAYVPVDPEYPSERITYMLGDISAALVVSNKASRVNLDGMLPVPVIELDGDWELIGKESIENPGIKASPSDLAYVIYTSGSTGRPKGVMIEHGSVVSLIKGADYINIQKEDVLLVTGSPSFDITTFEYWSMLLNGGRLILCSLDDLLNTQVLKDNINRHKVSVMLFTSSWFNQLVDTDIDIFSGLKTLFAGGEKLSERHVKMVREKYPQLRLINGYGPTENTTLSSTYRIKDVRIPIPIGRPLSNRKVYILNDFAQLCPVGISGEIYVSGTGIARGYLNNAELTAEKFVNDPFSQKPGARMYRTGDLGKWLPDGNIDYLGRKDDQVKIRGYRIELGEIESELNESGLVSQSVVLARQDSRGQKRLVGYVVPTGKHDKGILQDYLKSRLPAYMVPGIWVELDAMPLTTNGKVDKKALPEPVQNETTSGYAGPGNEAEAAMGEIWQELLGIEQIGIHDNFFELGGHSLLAIRIVSAIRKKMGAELSIMDLFAHPEIAGLVSQIQSRERPAEMLIPIRSTGDKIPLYIICGVGGTAFKFIEFVKLLNQGHPVYGLQQPIERNFTGEFPDTVEGIAGMFIKEIVKQNPEGPYALSGHCFGGSVAFEMAIQLKQLGKKVALLSLFDSYTPDSGDTIIHPVVKFLRISESMIRLWVRIRFKLGFETFLLLNHPREFFQYKISTVKLKMGLEDILSVDTSLNWFNETSRVYEAAFSKYKMKNYDGDMQVFYARDNYAFFDKEKNIAYKNVVRSDASKNTWARYAGSVNMYQVNGGHSTMFDSQYSSEFASILNGHLESADTVKIALKKL